MPSDAAFREALDALIFAAGSAAGFTFTTGGGVNHPTAQRLLAAESRVLALYAERERDHLAALEQVAEATVRMEQGRQERLAARPAEAGEEHEVERAYGKYLVLWRQTERWETDLNPGDRVTVRRCGEGA